VHLLGGQDGVPGLEERRLGRRELEPCDHEQPCAPQALRAAVIGQQPAAQVPQRLSPDLTGVVALRPLADAPELARV
jgi:hypothetical protein